mmetsp:Transcript_7883/g.17107  ORF Transcript_7883/g.17107 Transcript_7883/m.17107 type:complete len:225 (+) Transcript_7883:392-1066(+)
MAVGSVYFGRRGRRGGLRRHQDGVPPEVEKNATERSVHAAVATIGTRPSLARSQKIGEGGMVRRHPPQPRAGAVDQHELKGSAAAASAGQEGRHLQKRGFVPTAGSPVRPVSLQGGVEGPHEIGRGAVLAAGNLLRPLSQGGGGGVVGGRRPFGDVSSVVISGLDGDVPHLRAPIDLGTLDRIFGVVLVVGVARWTSVDQRGRSKNGKGNETSDYRTVSYQANE